jgi:pyruvate-formate lyase
LAETIVGPSTTPSPTSPQRHKNLIVRVWGWSGYFCELDEPYQDHIIGRHMLTM